MNYIFSWAEDSEGKLVHVDDVPRGLQCGCFCPNCHEQLLARQGAENEHGFAHHSKTRKATLEICYMVVLYKLAEQILFTKKRIHTPSYYGIFKERDLEFIDVKIDNRYEREDKQPDVVATTSDGRQYLIEFVFKYKVQHKKAIDYKNMTCLEVDLSNQSLETLESFLLSSSKDRKWLNNDAYFNRIEDIYRKAGKTVRLVDEFTCEKCVINYNCCAVRGVSSPLLIKNNGIIYRLCKTELCNKKLEKFKQWQLEKEKKREQYLKAMEERKKARIAQEKQQHDINLTWNETSSTKAEYHQKKRTIVPEIIDGPLSCLECKSNLQWKKKPEGWAHCGCYMSMGFKSDQIDPCHANVCSNYRRVENKNDIQL